MPALYVTRPGSVVRRSASSLLVTADATTASGATKRETLAQLQPHLVEAIGLVGRSHITSEATRLCLERGIAVSWFARSGRLEGRLVPAMSRTAQLRLEQYALMRDSAAADLCSTFISAKLRNGAAVVSALRSNRPRQPPLGKAIRYLRDAASRAVRTTDKDVLLGIEGDAAKTYFSAYGACFTGEIRLASRVRRPPPDPANSLLSFSYVLLANRVASLLEARGLDPYVGFLHTVRSGRPSLALDLIEELRHPLVDRFVLRVCNRRQLGSEHFEPDPQRFGGVRLSREGLRRFFVAWERLLKSPIVGAREASTADEVLRQQVDLMAAHVRRGDAYVPFMLPEKR